MAWDPLGNDEVSGDTPMDIFAWALDEAAARCERDAGRLPDVRELAAAFQDALIAAGYDEVEVREKLARFFVPSIPRERPDAPPRRAGQVLRIPYAGDGARAVYGRILFVPEGDTKSSDGICVVVLDRDVEPGDDLAELPDARWLVGPIGTDDMLIRSGVWEVIGELPLRGRELLLPIYEHYTPRGPLLVDYLGAPLEDTPENRSRLMLERYVECEMLVRLVRTQRYIERGPSDFVAYLPPPNYGERA